MSKYVVRRVLYSIPTVVLLSLVVFSAVRVLPGDVVLANLAESGFIPSEEQLEAIRRDLGLNEPFAKQYMVWLGQLVHGDLGDSLASGQSISSMFRQAMSVSIELGILAILVSLAVSVPLGVLAAVYRNTPVDYISRVVAVGGVSVPSFVLGMVVLLVGVRWFGSSPPTRYTPLQNDPVANLKQFIIPALILGYELAASVTRMTRSTVLEVLHEDYVRTAYAKGLMQQVVLVRHVLRNALIPVVTVVGLQVAVLFGGVVIIESVFSLPGVGQMLVKAVTRRDYPVVQATVLIAGLAVIIANLLVDLVYAYLDPRIRYG